MDSWAQVSVVEHVHLPLQCCAAMYVPSRLVCMAHVQLHLND